MMVGPDRDWGEKSIRYIREYLNHKPCLRGKILDRGELKRVAAACGLSPQHVRAQLKAMGFVLMRNGHGLSVWMKPAEDELSSPVDRRLS